MSNQRREELMVTTRKELERRMSQWFDRLPPSEVHRAARYAVLDGGHRWRGLFAVAIWKLFGSSPDIRDAVYSGAVSIELIHAASLVLDDLPTMDNAAMRRGKECTHLVFPGWAVDMLPVFLVTGAYQVFLDADGLPAERRLMALQELSRAGHRMINGQERDLTQKHGQQSADDLIECYRLKTGALWSAAGYAVSVVCGADPASARKISDCAMNLALYYQFLDDVGDATGTVATIGKTPGLDENKVTAVSIYGLEGATKRAEEFQLSALAILDDYGSKADFLRHLIHSASYVLE